MPLKLGTWKANVNGVQSDLSIASIASDGSLNGMILGMPISGFWDEVSQSVSFSTTLQDASVDLARIEVRFYRGYMLASASPQPGEDYTLTIAGYCEGNNFAFQNIPVMQPTARQNVFGWFAQIKEVI